MQKFKILLRVIGIVQLVLGVAFLLAPAYLLMWMGLSATPADGNYMLGMLSARFIAYGIGMFYIAQAPEKNLFWINNMILIQVVDLAVGLFYTVNSTISLSVSAFPLFNATLFIILLFLWRPRETA
ncbi:MAG: hypothetical protein KDE51_15075 [Anaerolineales bacterium]|nr:hypothetical protein [Anaerolineales bacterium]